MTLIQFALHIVAAVLLGAAVGLERQWRQRLAGLRTNALVSMGAAAFVALSLLVEPTADLTRIAAQVVSGIGFLGGGIILREGLNVRGLNTAATLWCSAAVGSLAGMGYLLPALVTALVVVAANVLLRPLALLINRQPVAQTSEVEVDYLVEVTAAKTLSIACVPCCCRMLRLLPAGAVAGWALHPLEKRRLVTAHAKSGLEKGHIKRIAYGMLLAMPLPVFHTGSSG
jgi:uncharacterized membrane protein YhiD involved in acid resistance